MFEFRHRGAGDFCGESQFVVVAGGSEEAAFEFCHDEEQAGFFDLAVVAPGGSEKFGSAHFEINEIVGMVQVAHRVGFDVTDSNLNFVLF